MDGVERFLHALSFRTLLPGPEAQPLVTYLGWRLHGARGGIAAGVLFVLPTVFIIFALSYASGGDIAWVQGISYGLMPAVIAIVIWSRGDPGFGFMRVAGNALEDRVV
jgi:chromate transporter